MTTHTDNASSVAANYDLTPSQLRAALEVMIHTDPPQPVFTWGAPGIGKSDIARQLAHDHGMIHKDIRAPLLDAVDLRGVPTIETDPATGRKVTRWVPPSFLPPTDSKERYLLVFDELPSAPPMVQNALYQLILDRRCGEYELPPGAAMMACGNRETDRGATYSMPTPLANRFVHLSLTPNFEEWETWALQNNIQVEIIFYLRFNKNMLHDFDPRQKKEKAFPSPRSWSFVNNIMQHKNGLSPIVERNIYTGAVGEAAAIEFCSFLDHYRYLPDPSTIFDNPEYAEIPEKADQKIALCAALYQEIDTPNGIRLEDEDQRLLERFERLMVYNRRMIQFSDDNKKPSVEIGQYLLDSCIRKRERLQYTQDWIRWTAEQNN